MKKLLTLIGAAAVSFGLYAAAVEPNGTGFESEEPGVPSGELPAAYNFSAADEDAQGNEAFYWFCANYEDVAGTVTAYETAPAVDNLNYLALETGSDPVYRAAAPLNEGDPRQVSLAGGVFFDQLVKFSAFDSDPTELDSTAKIAVWLKADEEGGETNLYVSTAVLGADLAPSYQTNLVLQGANVVPDSWHQLTITAIPAYNLGDSGYVPGFVVAVDGNALYTTETLYNGLAAFDQYKTPGAAKLIAEKKLFPSRIAYNVDESQTGYTLRGVGYQGSGAIDSIDINVGNAFEATATITAPANASIASVASTNGYAIIDNGNGTYTVAKGDAIRVTLAPAPGYHLGETTSQVFDVNDNNTEIGANDFTDITVERDATYVAEIVGGGKYESLADAVAAAGAGATVRLLDDYLMASTLVVLAEKSITLDLGGYTLTSTAPNSGDQCAILNYGTLGVSNGTFTATATTLIRTPGGTVTIYDGTYTAAQNGISCAPASGSALPWATGSTINFRGGSLKTVEMGLLTGKSANSTITVTGGTLTSTDNACIGDNGTANCGGHTINVTGATLIASITSSGYVACGIYIANSTALVVSNTAINVTDGCGILARGGNVTVQDGTAITTTGTATGKVGDSRVVVPCAAVVFDSGSAYPGYNPSTTEVVINGGTFSSADTTSVQLVGDAEKISIPSTSTAQFSDSNAEGVEAGYELVLDGETGLYKVAVSTYTLTYVTDKGTAPTAVTYTIESDDFAFAAAPEVSGYEFLGWVIGTTTNAYNATYVVADHLENTTATAAWKENAPVGPTVDGKTVEPTEVFNYANSAEPIVYPAEVTVVTNANVVSLQYAGASVEVPGYYDVAVSVSAGSYTVSLSLNENAIPEIAGATSSDPAMVVGSTTVSVGLATTSTKLWYGLSSCSTVGGEYTAPALVTQGTGSAMSLDITRGSGETTKFYKVYVTDVAPVTP